jgi:hypothetical protein
MEARLMVASPAAAQKLLGAAQRGMSTISLDPDHFCIEKRQPGDPNHTQSDYGLAYQAMPS